jgi:hypothetical protein
MWNDVMEAMDSSVQGAVDVLVHVPAIRFSGDAPHDPSPRVEPDPVPARVLASISRRRSGARSADVVPRRASTSFVHVKPWTTVHRRPLRREAPGVSSDALQCLLTSLSDP